MDYIVDDMLSRISEILNNPEAANKLKQIASSLNEPGNKEAEKPLSSDLALPEKAGNENTSGFNLDNLASAFSGFNGGNSSDKNVLLLNAIRPYMRESRASKINTAIKAIQVINLLQNFK
ncbi:MAG: hypothetical protein K0S55_439 [Clostridia bacterium]|nr:hypothetical protein [Clostridia bacterium]